MTLEITLSSTALSVPIRFLLPKVLPPVGSAPPPNLPMSTVVVAAKLQETFQRTLEQRNERCQHKNQAQDSCDPEWESAFCHLLTFIWLDSKLGFYKAILATRCNFTMFSCPITFALWQYLSPSISLHYYRGIIAFKSQVQYLSPISERYICDV